MVSHLSALIMWCSLWSETSLPPPTAQACLETGSLGGKLAVPQPQSYLTITRWMWDETDSRWNARNLSQFAVSPMNHLCKEQVTSRSACGKLGPGVGSLFQLLLPEFSIGKAYQNATLDWFVSRLFVLGLYYWIACPPLVILSWLRGKLIWGRKNHWVSPIWLCGGLS